MKHALTLAVAAFVSLLAGCALTDTAKLDDVAAEIRRSAERVEQVGRELARSAEASADLVEAVGETRALVNDAAKSAEQAAAESRELTERARQAGGAIGAVAGGMVAGPAGAPLGRQAGEELGEVILGAVSVLTLLAGGTALNDRKKRGQAESRAAAAEARLAAKVGP